MSINKTDIKNPFPGLRPFNAGESHLYFGREKHTQEVITKLEQNKFVAVVGTSGIGKSSFINCGILPTLQVTNQWNIVSFSPGESPLLSFCRAISCLEWVSIEAENLYKDLRKGQPIIWSEIIPVNENKILVFIDQFEEIFRNKYGVTSKQEVERLMEIINDLVQNTPRIHVAITLRSDFIGDCSQYPLLTNNLNNSQFLIPKLTNEESKLVIVEPLRLMGIDIKEELLVELLKGDGAKEKYALPVIQHTLMRTFDHWLANNKGGKSIGIEHYRSIGGKENALSNHATEIYQNLSNENKEVCERVFKALTKKNEEGRLVRHPATISDLSTITNSSIESIKNVVQVFRKQGNTFLTPFEPLPLYEDTLVDISHESIMHLWGILESWIEEEEESVKMYLRLSEAAKMQQEGKSGLWRPPDLDLALNWKEDQKPNKHWGIKYSPDYERTMLFLDYSKQEFENEQHRKIVLQKRRTMAVRVTSGILGLGAIIAFMFYLYGKKQEQEAKEQSKLAQMEKEKAVIEQQRAKKNEELAIKERKIARQKSIEAEQNAKLANKQRELALEQTRLAVLQKKKADAARKVALAQTDKANEANARANNLRLISIAKSMAIKSHQLADTVTKALIAQQAYWYNYNNGGNLLDPDIYDAVYSAVKDLKGDDYNKLIGHTATVRAIVPSPISKHVYSVGSDGKLIVWDDLQNAYSGTYLFEDDSKLHRTLAVSKDNKLVVGGDYKGLLLFDLNKQTYKKLDGAKTFSWYVGFSDPKNLIISASEKTVSIWKDEQLINQVNTTSKINCLRVHPVSGTLYVGTNKGDLLKLINETDQEFKVVQKYSSAVHAIAFDKDGLKLALGFESGKVAILNSVSYQEQASLVGHQARVNHLEFNKKSSRLASGSFDKTVRIWDMSNYYATPLVLKDHSDWVWSIAFDPSGNYLLAGCKDKLIRRWPTTIEIISEEVCKSSIVDRNLTSLEWENYVEKDVQYEETCLGKKNPNKEDKK